MAITTTPSNIGTILANNLEAQIKVEIYKEVEKVLKTQLIDIIDSLTKDMMKQVSVGNDNYSHETKIQIRIELPNATFSKVE